MSACYGSELVKSAEITCKGLHIELEIPFYQTYSKYQSHRNVAIPRPLSSGKTTTVYDRFLERILCRVPTAGVLWGTG